MHADHKDIYNEKIEKIICLLGDLIMEIIITTLKEIHGYNNHDLRNQPTEEEPRF